MFNLAETLLRGWACSTGPVLTDGNVAIEYDQLICLISTRQQQLSIGISEPVLIASRRGFCFFIDLLTVWSLGGIIVPYDPEEGEKHRQTLAEISGAKMDLREVYNLSVPEKHEQLNYTYSNESDTSAILFTSGTTGTPKGVVLSSYSLLNNSRGILDKTRLKNDRLFINIPFHFTSAICHFLSCALSGSVLVGVEKKLVYMDFVDAIFSLKPNYLGGAPIQYRWLAEYYESQNIYDSGINGIISSGDHLPGSVIKKLLQYSPDLNIYTVYGLTEVGGRFCVLEPKDLAMHIGSVGKPIAGLTYTIIDPDTGNAVGPDVEGEIYIQGQLLAREYFGNSEATSRSFTHLGFRTGDLGYKDKDGFLYLKGRADDVFKVNGKKVSAVLINQSLMETGAFNDVAVIASSIPVFGTVPVAFVVPRVPSGFSKGSILKKLRETLPNNHIPHAFIPVETIPRTGSGKIKRAGLQKIIDDQNR